MWTPAIEILKCDKKTDGQITLYKPGAGARHTCMSKMGQAEYQYQGPLWLKDVTNVGRIQAFLGV